MLYRIAVVCALALVLCALFGCNAAHAAKETPQGTCEPLPGWDGLPTCVRFVDEPWRECFSVRPDTIRYGCTVDGGSRGWLVFVMARMAPWGKACIVSHELKHVKEGPWHGASKHAGCGA